MAYHEASEVPLSGPGLLVCAWPSRDLMREEPLMRTRLSVGALAGLLVMMTSVSVATSNLNSSRSNVYRLVYSADAVSSAQAAAILTDLDKAGQLDEAKAAQLIQQLLSKHGVKAGAIKKVTVRPWDPKRKTMSIILLTNPADEAQAIAVSDGGTPADKSTKSTR